MIDIVYCSRWPGIELQLEKSGGDVVRKTIIAGSDWLNHHQIGIGNRRRASSDPGGACLMSESSLARFKVEPDASSLSPPDGRTAGYGESESIRSS